MKDFGISNPVEKIIDKIEKDESIEFNLLFLMEDLSEWDVQRIYDACTKFPTSTTSKEMINHFGFSKNEVFF